MNSSWRFLLDIEKIPADVVWAALEIGWERPFPGWLWGLLVIVGGSLAIWSYSGLIGNRRGRGALAAIRFVFLLLLLIVISGPTVIFPREHLERDWVLILLDRSQSMTVADVEINNRTGTNNLRISRDAQLAQLLRQQQAGFAAISAVHEIAWLGFDASAFDLPVREITHTAENSNNETENTRDLKINNNSNNNNDRQIPQTFKLPILGPADGRQTAIGPALTEALRHSAARPISGIVIFSDGQTNRAPDRAVLRRLQVDGIPIFVVPLGSATVLGDVAIREVRAPQRAFTHDKIPVEVTLDHLGAALERSAIDILLLNRETGAVLDRQHRAAGADVQKILLTATPSTAGASEWLVRIEPEIPDLIVENNTRTITIDLVDRPIRVLYLDGYPRWDYRYLKGLLVREASIDASTILLSADRDFAQEGNTAITRLPNSPEELEPYDVIIIGDVPAEFFSPRQLEMIYNHVSEQGAGLLWMAGPRSNPHTYVGTPLGNLLPIRSAAGAGRAGFSAIGFPVTMNATAAARRLGILNLLDQDGENAWDVLANPRNQWNQLRWALRIDPLELKPTAEVLARTVETFPTAPAGLPLVVQIRFGSGQSLFVSTDEIWRWRYGRGERLPEQFWIQIIRMLGRDRLAISGRSAALTASPRRVEAGTPAVLELRLFDEQLLEQGLTTIPAEIIDDEGRRIAELTLRRVESAAGRFTGTYLTNKIGSLRVRPLEAPFNRLELTASLEVFRADAEMQHPETDHAFLTDLAAQTGGAVIQPARLEADLPRLLPNRAVRTQLDVVEPIWDTPLVLAIFLLLLSGEWIGRKIMRFV